MCANGDSQEYFVLVDFHIIEEKILIGNKKIKEGEKSKLDEYTVGVLEKICLQACS